MTEERLTKIVHDAKRRLADIYVIAKEAMRTIDIKLQQILLDKEELDDKEGKENSNKKNH